MEMGYWIKHWVHQLKATSTSQENNSCEIQLTQPVEKTQSNQSPKDEPNYGIAIRI